MKRKMTPTATRRRKSLTRVSTGSIRSSWGMTNPSETNSTTAKSGKTPRIGWYCSTTTR